MKALLSFLLLSLRTIVSNASRSELARTTDKYVTDLQALLSTNASVSASSDREFDSLVQRWSPFGNPGISVVVQVATTQDVAAAVAVANKHGISFIAVNHKHGVSTVMETLQDGIQIDVSGLRDMRMSEDYESAVSLGGGVYTEEVINYLFEHGKMSASGSCGCVGLVGAALGGGIGKTQGVFGLMLDNILEATVVTASGEILTVSETSHPDLFWGLRGAGHNFGIVTALTYKAHDLYPVDGRWYVASLSFQNQKLEEVFELFNQYGGAQSDAGLTLTVQLVMNAELNDNEPSINLLINYAGSEEEASRFAKPFLELADAKIINASIPYHQVAGASGTGVDSPFCSNSPLRYPQLPIQLNTTHIPTIRAISDLFRDFMISHPGLQGAVALESYGWQAVRAVPAKSTAYPWRSDHIYAFFIGMYQNASLDGAAIEVGEQIRQLFLRGSGYVEQHSYVNYALGTETFGELYGHETWRQHRLRELKRVYDPDGKFSFYHPIPL